MADYPRTMWRLNCVDKIEPVEVVKETAQFLFIVELWNGKPRTRKRKKDGGWGTYHPTEKAAQDAHLERQNHEPAG